MNILFVAKSEPGRTDSGNEQRTTELYHALARLGTVYTLIPVKRRSREYDDPARRIAARCFHARGPASLPARLWRTAFGRMNIPWVSAAKTRPFFPGVAFDRVVVRYLVNAAETAAWRFGPCTVDIDDLPEEIYETQFAPRETLPRRWLNRWVVRRWQLAVCSRLAGGWVANPAHVGRIPGLPMTALPNIARQPAAGYRRDGDRDFALLTVGLMHYAPNHEGVDRFLREVWPALHAAYPALEYRIAGRNAPEACVRRWTATPGVRVLGFVEDLDAEYGRALACVAPIYAGSGTCIKTLEALTHGRVCLATPFALRGVRETAADATGLLAFDSAGAFLAHFARLTGEPGYRTALENAAVAAAGRLCGRDGFAERVAAGLAAGPARKLPVISVSCASDHNYLCGLWVTLHSLCARCRDGVALRITVLDTGLTDSDRTALRVLERLFPGHPVTLDFRRISVAEFGDLPAWRGSHTAYARLLLQDILGDEEYTVYTDVDTLWLRDVGELWDRRDERILQAVPDGSGLAEYSSGKEKAAAFAALGLTIRPEDYFCSGLLLMNLARLRESDFAGRVRALMREHPEVLSFPDQDIYNFLLPAPMTGLLEYTWGEFAAAYGLRPTGEPRVIHYANAAPWTHHLSAVGMLWWQWLADAAGTAALGADSGRFRRRARRCARSHAFTRSRLGGLLLAGVGYLFNPRTVRKRRDRFFPEARLR